MNHREKEQLRVQQLAEKYILQLISTKSVTSDEKGVEKAFLVLEKICDELGFVYERNADGMVMRISSKRQNFCCNCKLAIVCHIDTVDFNISRWKHNPLGEIEDGRIYGRGVIDDKGALILSLLAAKECEFYITAPWIIVVGSCEEREWIDLKKYHLENHPIPDYATTIDGDGIQFGCRGYVDVKVSFQRKKGNFYGILEEIEIPNATKNIVPGTAIARLSNGSIFSMSGKACHSSIPQSGENALILLAKRIVEGCGAQYPGFFELMNDIEDGYASNLGSIDYFNEINGEENPCSTVCPTMCWIEDDILTVNLNFRLSVGSSQKAMDLILHNMVHKYGAKEVEVSDMIPANYMAPESSMIISQLKAYQKVMGHETRATIAKGLGYNAAFEAKYGCNIFGPRFSPEDDEEDLCHSDDESRSIENLMKFYKMMCIFLEDFLA